ncbi:MAG: molecular chaperone DnaJ [Acidimicrobiia bacterium]
MNRDWIDKDFYKTLGVPKGADDKEIKKAYRKLAQENHPDTNPDDKDAEEKFKDISEAYATLSDAEKRKEYDEFRRMVDSGAFQGGPGGFAGGPFGGQQVRVEDLGDLLGGMGGLGDLFGGGRRSATGPQRGADLRTDLNLSFEDAVRGVTTTVSVRGDTTCHHCRGTGGEPGTSVRVCPTCGGAGTIAQNQGFFSFTQPCPECSGSGRLIDQPCSVCGGRGTEVRTRNVKVKIPAGVKNGATVRVPGKGTPGRNGGPAGDLLVRVRVAKHPVFSRRGNDLTIKVPITFTEAALGATIEVPTLDGPVNVKVPAGTRSGKTFRVRGKGVPNRGRGGSLLVTVEVVVPAKLPKEARKILADFRSEYEKENPRDHLRVS